MNLSGFTRSDCLIQGLTERDHWDHDRLPEVKNAVTKNKGNKFGSSTTDRIIHGAR